MSFFNQKRARIRIPIQRAWKNTRERKGVSKDLRAGTWCNRTSVRWWRAPATSPHPHPQSWRHLSTLSPSQTSPASQVSHPTDAVLWISINSGSYFQVHSGSYCCGSGMFIPALEFPYRIRTMHSSIFNPKKCSRKYVHFVQRCYPGSRGQKLLDPQHWITLSSSFRIWLRIQIYWITFVVFRNCNNLIAGITYVSQKLPQR
jgi:hypothetical protein